MIKFILFSLIVLKFTTGLAQGYDVFGLGIYDIKFDGSSSNYATDFRYERRFDYTLIDIGPESENFFNLKPFAGIEVTSESASYILAGVYLEDNLGSLFLGEKSRYTFTPSFGAGYYNDGDGKKLGNNLEFRTTFEVSYKLENFVLKLDLIKKRVQIDNFHYFEENFDLLIFSSRVGSTIRLQELKKTKRWQYYRSSVMGLGDSIYISSGICKSFKILCFRNWNS